ncbi:hypothetical protein [Salinivibrio sp. KP-1]|uniref:hypothetical protein n=1 Tax=Salinivibrio sp. KP-1 TaxID=1406902 RepID=UPI0006148E5A|nr:hypothetical protein [Salinivibrio sp. KP-1]KKA43450.1 hypothetical protein WN56_13775 [Salinivibrio sp. KP-1]
MNKLLVFFCFVFLYGCSNKAIYEGLMNNEKNQCANRPTMSSYYECMKGADTSYEQYNRDREREADADKVYIND